MEVTRMDPVVTSTTESADTVPSLANTSSFFAPEVTKYSWFARVSNPRAAQLKRHVMPSSGVSFRMGMGTEQPEVVELAV